MRWGRRGRLRWSVPWGKRLERAAQTDVDKGGSGSFGAAMLTHACHPQSPRASGVRNLPASTAAYNKAAHTCSPCAAGHLLRRTGDANGCQVFRLRQARGVTERAAARADQAPVARDSACMRIALRDVADPAHMHETEISVLHAYSNFQEDLVPVRMTADYAVSPIPPWGLWRHPLHSVDTR